jgi:predicted acetyltransferase
MLITKTDDRDKPEIYHLWKQNFAFDDDGYTDFFFSNDYDKVDNYVLKEKGELISCLQVAQHQIVVNDKVLDYDFIGGVITKSEHRHKGYMAQLLQGVLQQRQASLVIIQAYQPEIYKSLGFRDYCPLKLVNIVTKERSPATNMGPAYSYSQKFVATELFTLYNKFTADKNGYRYRDINYWNRQQQLLQAMNWQAVLIHQQDELVGYFSYHRNQQEILIEELLYLDLEVAKAAISYFQKEKETIKVRLMESDDCLQDWSIVEELIPLTLIMIQDEALAQEFDRGKENWYFNEYE